MIVFNNGFTKILNRFNYGFSIYYNTLRPFLQTFDIYIHILIFFTNIFKLP